MSYAQNHSNDHRCDCCYWCDYTVCFLIHFLKNATDATFSQETAEGVVLADFWAPWCGPCKMIAPVLEELDQEMGDKMKIVKIDVDDNQETAGKYGVMSIPTLLVLKDGEVVETSVGFKPKEALAELVNKHL